MNFEYTYQCNADVHAWSQYLNGACDESTFTRELHEILNYNFFSFRSI